MTEIDFDNIEARAVRTSAEEQILDEWKQLGDKLEKLRVQRTEINEAIRDLVEVRKQKARLVRVIDPSLIKVSSNGNE